MFVPGLIGGLDIYERFICWSMVARILQIYLDLWYNIVFAFLIIIFTYFYTAITVPTNKMADDLKRSGGLSQGYAQDRKHQNT